MKRITTIPDPYEPYLLSQGIRFGDLLFISGQAGYGADGRIVEGGFQAQGEQAFANLRRALEAGGSGLADVVKVTIFVTDMGDFPKVVDLRRKFFTSPYPADSIVEVKGLYTPEVMIEIEAIAAARCAGGAAWPSRARPDVDFTSHPRSRHGDGSDIRVRSRNPL
jgi:2-iminobutanoate/2-iminopropanoate deaminase